MVRIVRGEGVVGVRFAIGLAALALLGSGPALADSTTYVDPTENAFSVAVPAGWNVAGGVQRQSETQVHTWLAMGNQDGSTVMFMGDPEVPGFITPGPYAPANSWKATQIGLVFVSPYETGAQFAAGYAQRFAAKSCADVQITGTQAEPQFAQMASDAAQQFAQLVGAQGPSAEFDGGTAYFTCTISGKPYAGEVIAVTAHLAESPQMAAIIPQGTSSSWWVPDQWLLGFRAPLSDGADRDQMLRGLPTGFQINPQWRQSLARQAQQLLAQMQQNGQQMMASLQNLADSENQALAQMSQNDAQTRQDEHNSFMAMMDDQEASEKAGYDNHMRQKAISHFNEMLYITDQHCIQYSTQDPQVCTAYVNN
jgi:hypothetical protein